MRMRVNRVVFHKLPVSVFLLSSRYRKKKSVIFMAGVGQGTAVY